MIDTRHFQENLTTASVKALLNQLIDPALPPQQYAKVMYDLGYVFGPLIKQHLKDGGAVTLACTVEDADHLAAGIIDYLEKERNTVYLNVFGTNAFNQKVFL